MAIREDLVASATQFLQDPSVASSSVENRISFLRSKNLTQEEIDAAMSRAGGGAPPGPPAYQGAVSGPPAPYYQPQPFPANGWQPPPPPPRRDWRDWFIMATVVGGVSYGIYSLGKRYVMPLVAPPTPEKLEQDKKSIEEQFDRAFSLVEQLSKDTDELKKAEQQRTEKLDSAISELETVMSDLKSANRRREDDAQRVRDEVQGLKDSIPKAMNNQKEVTDSRLREINGELASLKTLVSQRMTSTANSPAAHTTLRATSGQAAPSPASPAAAAAAAPAAAPAPRAEVAAEAAPSPSPAPAPEAPKTAGRTVGGASNGSAAGKASIPAWQMAFANKNEGASSPANGTKSEDETSASSS